MSLPSQIQLAGIVYAASSGMRGSEDWRSRARSGGSSSAPVVYVHRLAIATVNVNRARQGMSIGMGAGHRGGSTERAAYPPREAQGLLGAAEEWRECQAAAVEALRTATLPLSSAALWHGAQFYEHRWSDAPRRSRPGPMGRMAPLEASIGPMWDPRPNKGRVWLDLHGDRASASP